jgi:hypothetical protein
VKSPRSIIMRKNAVERLRGALQSISISTAPASILARLNLAPRRRAAALRWCFCICAQGSLSIVRNAGGACSNADSGKSLSMRRASKVPAVGTLSPPRTVTPPPVRNNAFDLLIR